MANPKLRRSPPRLLAMRRLPLMILLTSALLGPTCSLAQKKAAEPSKGSQMAEIDPEAPVIKAAIKKAQQSLSQVLAVAESRAPQYEHVAVRILLKEGPRHELFWVTPFTQSADGFNGTINNIPTILSSVQLGQARSFKRADIVDWMYVDKSKGEMKGNFITCAQMRKEAPQDAKALKKQYGLDCAP